MTDAALRARRRDNAKLMETNLSLLMDIREVNNEIDEMRQKLGVQTLADATVVPSALSPSTSLDSNRGGAPIRKAPFSS
ncbi:hypothetical protein KRP22_005587 [Phytophthora ramorum]|nr:hypothetical protein KRP22_3281 [Phytophthora ramorum]